MGVLDLLGTVVNAGLNIVGGNKAAEAGAAGQRQADAFLQQQLDEIKNIKDPDLKELRLEKLRQVGVLTPENEESVLKESNLTSIKTDTAAKDAQRQVLQQLAQQGRTGLTPAERAQADELQRKSAASRQAGVQSVLQNLQMRGQSGGGAGALALLQAAQSGADQDSVNMDRLAGSATERALQSLRDRANLAGNMQAQDFSQQKDIANARDAVARFNQDMSSRNVNRRNAAQESNLAMAQGIANQNTGLGNEETRYNVQELPQRKFNNSMTTANLRANLYGSRAGLAEKRGQQAAQGIAQKYSGYGNMAQGVAKELGSSGADAASAISSGVGSLGNFFKTKPKDDMEEDTSGSGQLGSYYQGPGSSNS